MDPSRFNSVATSTRRPSLTLYPAFSLKTRFFYVCFGTCLIRSRCPNAPLLSDLILVVASYSIPRYLQGSLCPSSGRAIEGLHPIPLFYWWEGRNSERENRLSQQPGQSRWVSWPLFQGSFYLPTQLPPLCCSFASPLLLICRAWN